MKLLISLLTLAAATASNDVERRETAMEDGWLVGTPDVTYNSGNDIFSMTAQVGTANGNYLLANEVFDKCPNGDANFNGADFEGTAGSFNIWSPPPLWMSYLGATIPLISQVPEFYQFGTTFKINSNVANFPDIYSQVGTTGTVKFCMRLGLLQQSGPTLVNFKQFEVTVTYDLTDGFDVDTFQTEVIEAETDTFTETFETRADLCAESGAGPFNQGQEICIEVCPVAADIALVEVASVRGMTLEIDNDPNAASQVLLNNGSPVGSGVVLPPVCSANRCCQVRFILNGLFFPVGPNSSPDTIANVIGNGDCTLVISRRVLGETQRTLKEITSEFNTNFPVDRTNLASESSATKAAAMVAGAAGIAGALLL